MNFQIWPIESTISEFRNQRRNSWYKINHFVQSFKKISCQQKNKIDNIRQSIRETINIFIESNI